MSSTTAPNPVICVFCGSSPGTSPAHLSSARALATSLSAAHATLIYGGGTTGLMGAVAREMVALSGPDSVLGIIPRALVAHEAPAASRAAFASKSDDEIAAQIDPAVYGRTRVVGDMHTRKRTMAQCVSEGGPGSGFVALAGGFGTLEELMEMTTWNQLGIHALPVVLFNVEGYWDGIVGWVRGAVRAGFIGEANGGILGVEESAEGVVAALRGYRVSEGRFELTWDKT